MSELNVRSITNWRVLRSCIVLMSRQGNERYRRQTQHLQRVAHHRPRTTDEPAMSINRSIDQSINNWSISLQWNVNQSVSQNKISTNTRRCNYSEKVIMAMEYSVKRSCLSWNFILFHRRTRASYVYNGCLAWYNVVLTHGSTQAWNS